MILRVNSNENGGGSAMNISPLSAKPLRAETLPLLMAILALLAVEFAQHASDQPRWHIAVKVALVSTLMVAAQQGLSRCGEWGPRLGRLASPLLVGLALLPLPIEVIQYSLWKSGNPLEVLLLAGFRNLACGSAILSHLPVYNRVSSVISLFLMIFASCITDEPFVHILVVAYALCGVCWLMGQYWDSLRGRLTGDARQRRFPRRFLLTIPISLIVLTCLIPLAAPRVASALPGFMPTSGGDQWSDPNARSGVNDGEALVPATDQARSFGPVETEVFMESNQPSLYDIFNELYGEPPQKRNSKQDRAIGLPPGLLQHTHDRMAQQKKLGQQFSTVRSTRVKSPKKLRDIEGTALLYVGGRVPLHLRMDTFDLFNGVEWFPESPSSRKSGLRLEIVAGQPWIRVDGMENEQVFRHSEPHQLKIINLRTNRIPTPLGLTGIHIDRVDRTDMFGWAQESIVKMERDQLPELTVIHLQSRSAEIAAVKSAPLTQMKKGFQFLQLPECLRADKVRSLAREWSGNLPEGWPQVQAIRDRLRSQYTLDREYRPAASCSDTVGEFLFQSKRGPDYAFASAAATLLRSLGYSSRVVSGFYADPQKFDRKSRHTPITGGDAHIWTEVYVGNNTWLTVEATPGYEVLSPPPGIWDSLVQGLTMIGTHVYNNTWSYCLMVALSLVGWWGRVGFCDLAMTWMWRLRPVTRSRRHILRTVALLKQRARWAGLGSSVSQTPSRWVRELSSRTAQVDPVLARSFSMMIDWAAYAPPQIDAAPENNAARLCQRVVQEWTLTRLRSLKSMP